MHLSLEASDRNLLSPILSMRVNAHLSLRAQPAPRPSISNRRALRCEAAPNGVSAPATTKSDATKVSAGHSQDGDFRPTTTPEGAPPTATASSHPQVALNKPQAAAAAASEAAQVIEVAEQSDLQRLLKRAVEAQRAYSTFTQEQVDAIFTAAAFAANDARLPLAKMAVAGAEAALGGGLPCRRGGPAGRRGGLPACCLPAERTDGGPGRAAVHPSGCPRASLGRCSSDREPCLPALAPQRRAWVLSRTRRASSQLAARQLAPCAPTRLLTCRVCAVLPSLTGD